MRAEYSEAPADQIERKLSRKVDVLALLPYGKRRSIRDRTTQINQGTAHVRPSLVNVVTPAIILGSFVGGRIALIRWIHHIFIELTELGREISGGNGE